MIIVDPPHPLTAKHLVQQMRMDMSTSITEALRRHAPACALQLLIGLVKRQRRVKRVGNVDKHSSLGFQPPAFTRGLDVVDVASP